MTKIKPQQMPPKRLYDIDPDVARVFEHVENSRVVREQLERLELLCKEHGVDLKNIAKLSELAKLVPELRLKQKPGLKTRVDVLLEVARKASEEGISPSEASIQLFRNHVRFVHAKAKDPERWAELVAMYKLKS